VEIAVHGKQVDVGDALRAHAEARLREKNDKYFGRATHATVTFSRDGHGKGTFRVHIFVYIGSRNLTVNADAKDHDPYAAFEKAAEKVGKSWRRFKRKIRDDHRRDEAAAIKARDFILVSASPEEEGEDQGGDAGDSGTGEPTIVAEAVAEIDTLSVAEAVARMELAGQGAWLFKSGSHGGLNMVYRRADGHVGWVDPGPPKKGRCKDKAPGDEGCCGGGEGCGGGVGGGCCG
jgi:ribosomal subunit interface protein